MSGLFPTRASGLVASLVILGACSPTMNSNKGARVQIRIDREASRDSALSSDGGDVLLPDEFCYAINIVGSGIDYKASPQENVCGSEFGVGQLSEKAFNRGDTAEIEIKVGTKRRVELVGFMSPLGMESGRAKCGALGYEFIKGAQPIETRGLFRLEGQPVNAKPVLFAVGEADISPGDNVIVLKGVRKVSSPLTSSLIFGAPFLLRHRLDAPAACMMAPLALPSQEVFTASAIHAPDSSPAPAGVPRLLFMTATPTVFALEAGAGKVSAKPSSNANSTLGTGILEMSARREALRKQLEEDRLR